ncbi:Two-component system response regulator [Fulvivirga imtechensis AK7]|uniref:Two-component system response regulator n=1 Tax=Fulvivirga imtechensis AK7 TaxID=1237149 RepID=L8K0I9_9BACT|nr:sigma-54 dependent transcriptional regulator [Fulvivirga imtechensis]ELR73918.1 Two-component system response regulator [Fulvivirga imtechensis AK7]
MSKRKGSILIVDDDEDVLITARMILRNHFEQVQTATSPKNLESLIRNNDLDIIILDMNFKTGATSGNEGLFWLRKIRSLDASIHIIMNTAYGDIQLAVECMKEGAIDFLVKPWEREKLLATVINVYELKQSKRQISHLQNTQKTLSEDVHKAKGQLIGSSPTMQAVYTSIEKVAKTDANVLILGENGTGKELVARAIHQASGRANHAFIKVDLGALTDSLFESELFGHKKGAFTDAKEDRAGRFEIADKGTLFLDEIGNISLAQQAKLLSVLQNRQVARIGDNKLLPIDIRVVCATNKDIYEMVEVESFRQDLLYRINTVEIELPPLRERKEDIEELAKHFLSVYCRKYEKDELKLAQNTVKKLQNYPWPGNVRELQHAVERAVIMSTQHVLDPADFLIKKTTTASSVKSLNVEDIEKNAIVQAIEKCNGNLTSAARELGLGRSTLYRKIEKYGL